MQTFDWIVVGNGLAGAAASYELARQGLAVLLVDQSLIPESATRYSYGGIPHWSGTNSLTKQLCQEGIAKQRQLTEELGADTQFRELDLLLTVAPQADLDALTAQFAKFANPPQFLTVQEAHALEPQINPQAIAGAFTVRHGHVSPMGLVQAYNQAFQRLGGTLLIAPVRGLVRVGAKVTGLMTDEQAYPAQQVLVAAGAFSRRLLQDIGLAIPLYYTHAELIETPPLDLTLRTLVMPANNQRFALEAKASAPAVDPLWNQPGHEITPPILDSGAIQFQDGHLCIGQISRTLTDVAAPVPAGESETAMRQAIGHLLPALAGVSGTWHRCLVSFSRDGLPLVGPLPGVNGLHLFTGFNSPFVYVPAIAQRFAHSAGAEADNWLAAMAPGRFPTVVQS
ncbi:MAG: NAD(P)/FAD-dependent oxidoreductase [Nodosilinea sp.]